MVYNARTCQDGIDENGDCWWQPGCEPGFLISASANSCFHPDRYNFHFDVGVVEIFEKINTFLASTTRSVKVFRRKRCPFSTWRLWWTNIVLQNLKILTGSRSRKSNVRSWSFITWKWKYDLGQPFICWRGSSRPDNIKKTIAMHWNIDKTSKSTSSPSRQPPPSSISRMLL